MALILLFAVCSLLQLWETQGSSAVTTVFVQKGKDLYLDVKTPVVLVPDSEFRWKFNSTNILRLLIDNRTRMTSSYVGRAEVSLQNHSLLLKNVQQADSGDYTAHIIADKDQSVAEYKVIIQDPASPVKLSVNSVSNSTECNLTVTCSTDDSHIISTFRCDTQTCYQKGGEKSEVTTSGSSLGVFLSNVSIICNHSNQVSGTRDMREIRPLCSPIGVSNGSPAIATWIWIPVVLSLCICFGLVKVKYKRKNYKNTVYEVPQNVNPVQTPNPNAAENASATSPTSTYALVTFHTGPKGPTKTTNTTMPETIYAQVTKGPKPQSPRSPEDKKTNEMHSKD